MTDTQLPPVRPKQRMHLRYTLAAVACLAIVAWMFTELRGAVVYLRPVSYAVSHRSAQGTRTFRMGGTVVPGTIAKSSDGARFEVMEGGAKAQVDYSGGPRDLFRDCAPVVVEGHWAGNVFTASRLLIRHGSAYDASKRADANCRASTS
ncbi:MAG: cytochrome c-type biosis protein CcmE [Actinomycetia bacterium]|nr:cytochrome c-type biosis protein CcmE [Actinomycetes bacterium]